MRLERLDEVGNFPFADGLERRKALAGQVLSPLDLGRYSASGRWVGRTQPKDHEWREVWGAAAAEDDQEEREYSPPACPRCGGENLGECGDFAAVWRAELESKVKAARKQLARRRDRERVPS